MSFALAKYDLTGAHIWSRGYPVASGSFGSPVSTTHLTTGSGDAFVAGNFMGIFDAGAGQVLSVPPNSWDILLARFSGIDGTPIWNRRLAHSSSLGSVTGVVVVSSVVGGSPGHVLVAGSYSGALDLGGGPLPDVADGAFVVRLDAAGQHIYSKAFAVSGGKVHPFGVWRSPDSQRFYLGLNASEDFVIDGTTVPKGMSILNLWTSSATAIWRDTVGGCSGYALRAVPHTVYDQGVRVLAVCPQAVDVGFGAVSGRVMFGWNNSGSPRFSRGYPNGPTNFAEIVALARAPLAIGVLANTVDFAPCCPTNGPPVAERDVFVAKFVP
jgi:hypothetical protein